jgi:NADPH:quinone reductase-like Zn-dependent oxidoreductase
MIKSTMKAAQVQHAGEPAFQLEDVLKPHPAPGQVLPLTEARRAHEILEGRQTSGKLVLNLRA